MAEDNKPVKKASKKKKVEEAPVEQPAIVEQAQAEETPAEAKLIEVHVADSDVLDFTTHEQLAEVVVPSEPEVKEVEVPVEVIEAASSMEEVVQIKDPKKELSRQAKGWRDWLAYQKMTPEDFIKKYPAHKMRHLIQEILDFNAKK